MGKSTFKPYVGGQKSRQVLDWQHKTGQRSGTNVQQGAGNLVLVEVKKETQIHKIDRSIKRLERRIKRYIEEKYSAGTSPERKQELEFKILRATDECNWKQFRKSLILRGIDSQTKRMKTTYENEKKRQEQARKNREKIPEQPKKETNGFHPVGRKLAEEAKEFSKKKVVKSSKGSAKVVSKKYKPFSNK